MVKKDSISLRERYGLYLIRRKFRQQHQRLTIIDKRVSIYSGKTSAAHTGEDMNSPFSQRKTRNV